MKRRALLVCSSYEALAGRHNDLACMRRVLERYDFETTCLVDRDATRTAILSSYDALIAATQPDDAAVFYYTGHGGLVTNSDYQPSDELPPHLQHICPSDFGATVGQDFRGITSFELSLQLAALSRRTANATVIFECCFSA